MSEVRVTAAQRYKSDDDAEDVTDVDDMGPVGPQQDLARYTSPTSTAPAPRKVTGGYDPPKKTVSDGEGAGVGEDVDDATASDLKNAKANWMNAKVKLQMQETVTDGEGNVYRKYKFDEEGNKVGKNTLDESTGQVVFRRYKKK